MKKEFLTILCLLNMSIILPQSSLYIVGRIIDPNSSVPVPFATIRLKNNQIGVFANAGGEFRILNKNQFLEDSLIISCIGFTGKSVKFKDLNSSGINTIYLYPVTYRLSEVRVSARKRIPGSIVIISRAIKNIKDNYPSDPFSYIAYFRDYQKVNGNYINLNESIVQTLDNGFISKSYDNKYRLLAYNKNSDFPRISIIPFYDTSYSQRFSNEYKTIPGAIIPDPSGNELFILRAHDAIRNYNIKSFSFIDTLSVNLIKNHIFSKPKFVLDGNMPLYRIDFTILPKLINDTLTFEGSIYIRLSDYSIHKLEYSGFYRNDEGKKKDMFSIKTEYGYNPMADSLMYLKYISFSNIFQIPDSTDKSYFRIIRSYTKSADDKFCTLVVEFNKKIDPVSAKRAVNYNIKVRDREAKILKLNPVDDRLFIEIKNDNFQLNLDTATINIRNLKDINGKLLNKKRSIEIYQFRELFVQENNKEINCENDCFMEQLPLERNCITKTDSIANYWMNTPEKIK